MVFILLRNMNSFFLFLSKKIKEAYLVKDVLLLNQMVVKSQLVYIYFQYYIDNIHTNTTVHNIPLSLRDVRLNLHVTVDDYQWNKKYVLEINKHVCTNTDLPPTTPLQDFAITVESTFSRVYDIHNNKSSILIATHSKHLIMDLIFLFSQTFPIIIQPPFLTPPPITYSRFKQDFANNYHTIHKIIQTFNQRTIANIFNKSIPSDVWDCITSNIIQLPFDKNEWVSIYEF